MGAYGKYEYEKPPQFVISFVKAGSSMRQLPEVILVFVVAAHALRFERSITSWSTTAQGVVVAAEHWGRRSDTIQCEFLAQD